MLVWWRIELAAASWDAPVVHGRQGRLWGKDAVMRHFSEDYIIIWLQVNLLNLFSEISSEF